MDREALRQFSKAAFKIRQGFIWFLRFVGVFLLIMVVSLAIFRQLPWKVPVVLSIVPVLGIIVPRKWVVWVWMLPLVGFMGIYIWIQLPESDSSNWQPYQFETENEVLIADWQIAPNDNAAIQYEQVLTEYDESVFGYQFLSEQAKDATFTRPWRSEQYPKLAAWMKTFDEGIARLIETGKMRQCRFPIAHNQTAIDVQQRRINQLKGWTRLLLRSANLDLGEGRLNAALEKQLTTVRIAQHLYDQQSLFDQSGAFYIELLASRALKTMTLDHFADPNRLRTIETAFVELDSGWAKSWAAIVEKDKLVAKNIAGLFYEINENGRTRISHQSLYALQEGLGYQPRRMFLKQHEMNRLAVIGFWLSLPFTPEGMAKLIDKRFDHYSLQTQKGDTPGHVPVQRIWQMGWNCKSPVDWMAMQQVKWFWALDGQDKRHDALVNLMQIFVALKKYHLQHNRWPAALSELDIASPHALTDPVHGHPFAYHLQGDNFLLYSLGPNAVDDNGVNHPKENKDDIVFWPRGMLDEAIRKSEPPKISKQPESF